MKTSQTITILLLLSVFFSCSDNRNNDEQNYTGKLIIDNTTFPLSHGVIEYGGSLGSGHLFGIALGSEDIRFADGAVEGTGNILYLHVFSSSQNQLSSLTYSFDNTNSGEPATYWGYAYINRNFATGSLDSYYFITSGTLSFSAQPNTTLEITGTCKKIVNSKETGDGIELKLSYSGDLKAKIQEKNIREI